MSFRRKEEIVFYALHTLHAHRNSPLNDIGVFNPFDSLFRWISKTSVNKKREVSVTCWGALLRQDDSSETPKMLRAAPSEANAARAVVCSHKGQISYQINQSATTEIQNPPCCHKINWMTNKKRTEKHFKLKKFPLRGGWGLNEVIAIIHPAVVRWRM